MKQTLDLVIYLQRNSKASNKKAILMKMLQIALSDKETIQLATKGYLSILRVS